MYGVDIINQVDVEVASAIQAEVDRQESHIELIASENFTSRAVQLAAGNPLTNKYAEGYPGNRYYGGCEYVDVVENIAIERAKSSSTAPTPTSSPTPAPRPTWPWSWPCSSPATP